MDTIIFKNYRDDDTLRHSFNELAMKTFDGLSFEAWYQNGYWSDRYNPYSIVDDNRVIANVSVNRMDFMWNGERKRFIQLGTVMTDERYRNQGLIRRIMDEIEQDYGQTSDGIYLFANDSVLDFYPKFGFRKTGESCYTKSLFDARTRTIAQCPMRNRADWDRLSAAMRKSVSYSSFDMTDNADLIMFYITGFMQDCVYYEPTLDVYVIAEMEEDTLIVHNIFSKIKYPMNQILAAFGADVKQIALGFTPQETDMEGYTVSDFKEEDCTLFVKGGSFDDFEKEKLIFPTLSHA